MTVLVHDIHHARAWRVPTVVDYDRDPTVTDDQAVGFDPCDQWCNVTTATFYRCHNSTSGKAVWVYIASAAAPDDTA